MLDPSPTETRTIASVLPPRHFEEAVADGVERIRAGDLDKVVLAREVAVDAALGARPGGRLRGPARALPVVLLLLRRHARGRLPRREPRAARPPPRRRRRDRRARRLDPTQRRPRGRRSPRPSSCCRARRTGSSTGSSPSGSPASSSSRAVWVEAGDEPEVIKVANIQHLATPVHAQLADPVSAVDLAGAAASDAGRRRRAGLARRRS